MVDCILLMADWGWGSLQEVRDIVQDFVKTNKIKTQFTEGRPGPRQPMARYFEPRAMRANITPRQVASRVGLFARPEPGPRQTGPSVIGLTSREEVLSTPKLFVGDACYLRKLSTFNFTIYNYGTDEVFCCLWRKHIASRGSNEVASCVVDYIEIMAKRNVKIVSLLSDNCGGKNQNRTIAFALWYSLTKYDMISIKHQFLVVGHKLNEGDSVHSAIENASRKIEIYTLPQWAATVRTVSPKRQYLVKEQTREDFTDFKQISETLPNLDLDKQRIG
ncbi:hypothetical protein RRG08_025025 [Elysia crispata]|uniref:DUF7869 domain-containing protein n=1 Tax=Elysia crispata TaxID=231223 RepID=A0AAE1AP48_9GAST|nr:hypothetical protein RRG08_025025 [Elysia crispata]